MKTKHIVIGGSLLYLALCGLRLYWESGSFVKGGLDKTYIGSRFDPRNQDRLDEVLRNRESDSFRSQVMSGLSRGFVWPGLQAAQVSWTWLELLQGLHVEASYKNDFSWMFSKLYKVALLSSPKEIEFLTTLTPFFFVMGSDQIGANIFIQELQKRAPQSGQAWFWSGYHAMENLKDRSLAGEYMREAAKNPGSPHYAAALSVRLKKGEAYLARSDLAAALEADLSPELLEKVKKSRPTWFEKK